MFRTSAFASLLHTSLVKQTAIYNMDIIKERRCTKDSCITLYRAISKGDLAKVRELLSSSCDIECKSFDHEPALIQAITRERLDITHTLLEHNANIDCSFYFDVWSTSLIHAMEAWFKPIFAQTLIAAGADVNASDTIGDALDSYIWAHLAPWNRWTKEETLLTIRMLLCAGLKVNANHLKNLSCGGEVQELLVHHRHNPMTLMQCSRVAVRDSLRSHTRGRTILPNIQILELPEILKMYLSMKLV